jgi:hypothetical protein
VDDKDIENFLNEASDDLEDSNSSRHSSRPISRVNNDYRRRDSDELMGTGKEFLKIRETKKAPSVEIPSIQASFETASSFSVNDKNKDSRSNIDVEFHDEDEIDYRNDLQPHNQTGGGIGQDTLEEIEDKARFFKELEKQDEDETDYAALNEQLQHHETMKTLIESEEPSPKKNITGNSEIDLESILGVGAAGSGDAGNTLKTGLLGKVALESTESVMSHKFLQQQLQSTRPLHSLQQTGSLRPTAGGGMTGTSTEFEALKEAFAGVQHTPKDETNDFVGPALLSSATSGDSDSFQPNGGGGDDMPDTGDPEYHFPGKPFSTDLPTETSDYSEKGSCCCRRQTRGARP